MRFGMSKKAKRKPSPKPLRVKFEGTFDEAAKAALDAEKPEDGWPSLEEPEAEEEADKESNSGDGSEVGGASR